MKRKSLLFLLLFALLAPWAAQAQTTVEIGDGTAGSNRVPIDTYYNYSISEQLYTAEEIGMAGTINSISFNYIGSVDKDFPIQVYMQNVDAANLAGGGISLADAELVFEGTYSVTASAGWVTITLDTPFAYDGTSNLLIGVNKDYVYWYSGNTWQCTATAATMARYSENDDNAYNTGTTPSSASANRPNIQMEIVASSGPFCAKPAGVTVNYTGGTTAEVSWTSEATSFNIDVNGVVTNNVTNPYPLTGLDMATTYTVKVQAVCGGENGSSDWTSGTSFTTDICMPEEQCNLTFVLTDTYGDSWNGNAIQVKDVLTGIIVATLANQNLDGINNNSSEGGETQTVTLAVCDGRELEFSWVSGSYVSEVVYTVTDINGEVIVEGSGVGFTTFNYTVSCTVSSCRKPTDLTTGEVGKRNATIRWTENGEATAWQVEVTDLDGGQVTTWNANATTFEIVGLTPDTRYSVRVKPDCEEEKWSNAITFRTEVACPAPTDLTVVPTPFSANVSWTGEASSYNLCYGVPEEPDPTQPATIILTVGDVWGDGTGYQMLIDADATAYGTVIPTSGALSTNCSGNEDIYAEFEYMIPANADGDCSTSNIVLNNSISLQIPAGTYDWCITNPTPDDRIWIASANGVGGRHDDYVFEAGMVYEFVLTLDSASGNDQTDVTISSGEVVWTCVENVTSPYTIEGLTPETEYYVKVQAVCGGEDGESDWTNGTFTTPSNCDAPFDLNVPTATLMPTSATLNWTGYQDGFEVWYRPAAQGTELVNEDFEEDFTWTTIDADGDGYDWVRHVNTGTGNYNTHSGDASVNSGSYDSNAGALTPDNYLVSPQVELGGTITFWASAQDASWPSEHFGVAVSTTNNTDASAFTTLQEWTMTAKKSVGDCKSIYNNDNYLMKNRGNRDSGEWYEYTVDLSAYAGQTGYVAIRHFNCTDMFYLVVDDIVIAAAATEEQEWIPVTSSTTSVDITGLEPGTTYEWQVRGENRNCGDEGYTEWSEISTFTTPSFCDKPINLNAEVEGTTVTLSWTGYQDSFDVTYYIAESGQTFFEDEFFDEDWTPMTAETDTLSNFYYLASDYSVLGYGFHCSNTPQYLISPAMEGVEGASILEFTYFAPYEAETFSVGYSTTDNEIESFTWLDEATVTGQNWYDAVFPEGVTYFAIKYTSDHQDLDSYLYVLWFTLYDHYIAEGPHTTLTGVTSPVTITGLDEESIYKWEVLGISEDCDELAPVSGYFLTEEQTTVTQTVELVEGWNWFSTYVETTLDVLKSTLVEAYGNNTTIKIKVDGGLTTWNGRTWRGNITWDVTEMCEIQVESDNEITLEGMPINPAEHPITIHAGANWIGFPFSESMTLADAFNGFAVNGDKIKSMDGLSTYNGRTWRNSFPLEPSHGYIYTTNDDKTFVYPTSAGKAAQDVNSVLSIKKTSANIQLGDMSFTKIKK